MLQSFPRIVFLGKPFLLKYHKELILKNKTVILFQTSQTYISIF